MEAVAVFGWGRAHDQLHVFPERPLAISLRQHRDIGGIVGAGRGVARTEADAPMVGGSARFAAKALLSPAELCVCVWLELGSTDHMYLARTNIGVEAQQLGAHMIAPDEIAVERDG